MIVHTTPRKVRIVSSVYPHTTHIDIRFDGRSWQWQRHCSNGNICTGSERFADGWNAAEAALRIAEAYGCGVSEQVQGYLDDLSVALYEVAAAPPADDWTEDDWLMMEDARLMEEEDEAAYYNAYGDPVQEAK